MNKNLHAKYADIMPKGAGALFFIQIFSTLAFSVLYSSLILYATNGLHLSDKVATSVTATFIALNYTLHLIGGFLGGRLLSYRSLLALGMFIQIISCILLSLPSLTYLFWGLAGFVTGAGLNVTCINCILTQLFKPDDHRREAAFLWNYSGMNIGFLIGFSVSGYLQLHKAYSALFLFATFGNLIALLLIAYQWKVLNDTNTRFLRLTQSQKKSALLASLSIILILVFILHALLKNAQMSNSLIMLAGSAMFFLFVYLAIKQPTASARKKIWAYLILAFTAIVFFTLYQLSPMGLILFIERNVTRHYFNMQIAPQWIQNINTLIIIFGGPLLSFLFTTLRKKGIHLTIPLQFGIALLLTGTSLIILPVGIHFANAQGYVSLSWIILTYILQSLGELFISPIGYAMIGKLAPPNLQGLMMGTWLMLMGIAAALSGYFSMLALGITNSRNPLLTNPSFSHIFNLLGWSTIFIGIILLICLRFIVGLMQEKKLSH